MSSGTSSESGVIAGLSIVCIPEPSFLTTAFVSPFVALEAGKHTISGLGFFCFGFVVFFFLLNHKFTDVCDLEGGLSCGIH